MTENEFPARAGRTEPGGGTFVGRFNHLTAERGPVLLPRDGDERPEAGAGAAPRSTATPSSASATATCTPGCVVAPAFVFGNTWTFGASEESWLNNILNVETQRTWRSTNWSQCNGLTPFDVNDGYTQVSTATIASLPAPARTPSRSRARRGRPMHSTSPRAPPGASFYVMWDLTAGWLAGIASNTASSLTTNFAISAVPAYPATKLAAADDIVIYSSTLYAAGTHTGASGTSMMTDSTKTGPRISGLASITDTRSSISPRAA